MTSDNLNINDISESTLDIAQENNIESVPISDIRSLPPEERKIIERQIFDNLPDDDARIAWNEGWRTKELYNNKNRDGSERPFIDYKEFLANSRKIAPIRNERLRELADKNYTLEQEIREMKENMRALLELNKNRESRDLENTQTYLNKEIQKAKEDLDFDRYEQLLEQKQKYNNFVPKQTSNYTESVAQVPPSLTPQDQMALNGWQQNNGWFNENVEMRNMAIAYDNSLLANPQTAHLPLNQRLEMVSAKMKTIYPDKFKRRSSIQMVEGNDLSGMGGSSFRQKTYNDLPADAKLACKYAEENPIPQLRMTREQYVKDYFKDQK